jgi:hypothetical protein
MRGTKEDGVKKDPTPIRITFNNETIEVDVTLDEWNRAYQQALEANTMVEIQEPDGRILSINPLRVDTVQAR